MKKFLTGIIIGALLMSAIPIYAAVEEYILYKADYKLIINDTEYTDEELPLLNYKGYTYAPIRSVFEAAGLDVEWNGKMKKAIVSMPEQETQSEQEQAQQIPDETETTQTSESTTESTTPIAPTIPTTPTAPSETTTPTQTEPQSEPTNTETPQQPQEPEPEQPQSMDGEGSEVDMEAYEAELTALTSAYEADIAALNRERYNELNKAIGDYEKSVYNLIQMGVNARVEEIRINAITQGINGKYQQLKDARTARYNSDVAALRAKYGL